MLVFYASNAGDVCAFRFLVTVWSNWPHSVDNMALDSTLHSVFMSCASTARDYQKHRDWMWMKSFLSPLLGKEFLQSENYRLKHTDSF